MLPPVVVHVTEGASKTAEPVALNEADWEGKKVTTLATTGRGSAASIGSSSIWSGLAVAPSAN